MLRGFALDQFSPSERGSEWFAADSLDFRGKLRPTVGVVGSWGYRPLVARDPDDNYERAVVRNQFVLHPGIALVIVERLRRGLDLPVQAYADGKAATVGTTTFAPPENKSSLGDLRLAADVAWPVCTAIRLRWRPGRESEDVLQAVLKVLGEHPEIRSVRVEGHTDNTGSAGRNRTLSQERAGAVLNWLVAHRQGAPHQHWLRPRSADRYQRDRRGSPEQPARRFPDREQQPAGAVSLTRVR